MFRHIAFYGPLSTGQILDIGLTNDICKFCIAVAVTPVLHVVHEIVDRYLGTELAHSMEM